MASLAVSVQVDPENDAQAKRRKRKSCPSARTLAAQKRTAPAHIRRMKSISEIRRRVSNGESNAKIIKEMDIAPRTFFRWMKQAYQADEQALKSQDKAMLALELTTLRDRLTLAYGRMLKICQDDTGVAVLDRLKAEASAAELAVLIARLALESPMILRGHADLLKDLEP